MVLLSLTLLLSANRLEQTAAQKGLRPQPGTRTIILKVVKTETGGYMEPVVILDGGRYREPIPADADRDRFNAAYYSPGQSYRMLAGGGEAGRATVLKPTSMGCQEWGSADVRMQSTFNIEKALATNSGSLGRRRKLSRAPNNREREAALKVARTIFRQNRVPSSLIRGAAADNLVATDLGNDGHAELVGNFRIGVSRDAGIPDYTLLLVLEPEGKAYRVALARYYRIKDKYRQTGVQSEDFLGQLDLDGDGTDELIVETQYWEAWTYYIYKKQRGAWRRVYQGGGSGC